MREEEKRAETAPAMAIQSVIFCLFQLIPAIWSYLFFLGYLGLFRASWARTDIHNTLGYSPLMTAAQSGHSEVCSLLLDAGSDLEEMKTGSLLYRPLHKAAINGRHSVVMILLSRGAQVDSLTHHGFSALHLACGRDNPWAVARLARHPAIQSLNARDCEGCTPIMEAVREHMKEHG